MEIRDYINFAFNFLNASFIFVIGLIILVIIIMFIIDITQTKDAIRRNYPLIGRFRSLFLNLGEFFRQYFFALDREEMPFNRAERNWVKRAAKNKGNVISFGSTENLNIAGTPIFVNAPFPRLEKNNAQTAPMTIGEYCKTPYDAKSILNISAMSYGALSAPAITALSKGANIAECWLNTGEGGLSEYHLSGNCDLIFQIGTAKYGVRNKDGTIDEKKLKEIATIKQVKMFELKLSQGAKPGKGGILPAKKVTKEIAEIRGIEANKSSISPNRHFETSNTDELLDFINYIRNITGKPVGFKSVISSEDWLEELCKKIMERGTKQAPDFITIDGGDGGTGAAPMPLMDNVGLPLKESLPMTADILAKHGLKKRIKIIASGKLITPAEVAWALCAGANFINTARGFMFALGCIQSLKCSKNTCPTGIATHNKRLQNGLNPKDKSVKVANYCKNLTKEVEIIAHSCGVKEPRELNKSHVRIVQPNGMSVPFDKL